MNAISGCPSLATVASAGDVAGAFCGAQHQILFYDNEVTGDGAAGLAGNSDTDAREMSVATTAHLIFVAATSFAEVQTPFPS